MSTRDAALPVSGVGRPHRDHRELWLWTIAGLAVCATLFCAAADTGPGANVVLALFVAPLVVVSYQRTLLAWRTLMGAILLVILFIPIRRYTVGGGLPIELEPYRVLIAVVLAMWLCAVAADPAVRWRATGLEAPIITLLVALLLSLALNAGHVSEVSGYVVKQASFFASYFLVVYFIASVIGRGSTLDGLLRLLVGGGAVVAIASLVEWQTGQNLFNWFGRVMPFLHYVDIGEASVRGSGVRAFGSAQHAIPLGAALVMLVPPSVYLFRRDGHLAWLLCGALLTLGAFSTGSRTAALMLVVLLVTFLWVRREDTLRLLPYLLPLLVVIQVVMPGTLGSFRAILNPSYVVKEQSVAGGTGSGRIADIGPSLEEWSKKPFLGQGFGTRITETELKAGGDMQTEGGAQILDNQWLGSLLETGAIGLGAMLWLFGRAVNRLRRKARDPGLDGLLAATLAASLTAFAVGLVTYDAFAFIQVTFLAFIMLGFAAVVTREPDGGRAA